MKLLCSILFSLLLFFSAYSQENYKQVEIKLSGLSDVQKLRDIGLVVDEVRHTKNSSIVAFLSDSEFKLLQSSGFSYNVLIDDWYAYFNALPKLTDAQKEAFINESSQKFNVKGFGYGSHAGFYTVNEVNANLDSMRVKYPNLISTKSSIGNTVENRPVYMVKISDNPDVDENEPEVLFTAMTHAREPQGMMCVMYYMYYLLENYNTNPSVKYLVDNREIYFIPVVNVDGYTYNITSSPSGGGMWRKNRKNNGGSYGVDLNRNFGPYDYWNAPNGGSSTSPSADDYRGTAPFSEPETNSYKTFVASRYFKACLNYHTYSDLLIYPYGAKESETPDSVTFREYATDMVAFNGYQMGTDLQTVGYSTRGNSDDFLYDGDTLANHGKIFAMTPEVGSTGFWPAQSEIFPLAIENLQPNLYYTYIAGEYVKMVGAEYNKQYYNPGDQVTLLPTFKNKGLSGTGNLTIELTPISQYASVVQGILNVASIPARGVYTSVNPLSFNLAANTPVETKVKLLLTVKSAGVVMSTDTLSVMAGVPSFVLADTTNDPNQLWTIAGTPSTSQKWEATTTVYHSSPNSYTDSKTGNYVANATITMVSKDAINIQTVTNPRLAFWTKWDIETDWDYGMVELSTNNGSTWVALQGNYTNPGTGTFQPNGQPLYDGVNTSWVRDEISLNNYKTSPFKLRFKLITDGSQQRDGWYVDDIGIFFYTVTPVELTSFTASSDDNTVALNWVTETELNNKGFEVERGIFTDGKVNYSKIGFVNGNGTIENRSEYSFIDNNPVKGDAYYRIKQIDYNGTFRIYGPVEVGYTGVTEYALGQNYPNPFNPATTINFSLPRNGNVSIKVFDVLGKEVKELVNGYKEAGKYSVVLDAKDLTSGIYFYKIEAAGFTSTKKMTIIK